MASVSMYAFGHALADRLERGDRPVELLAVGRVLGRDVQGLVGDAGRDRAQTDPRERDDPRHRFCAPTEVVAEQHRRGRRERHLELRLVTHHALPLDRESVGSGFDEEEPDRTVFGARRNEHRGGNVRDGNGGLGTGERPRLTRHRGPRGRGLGLGFVLDQRGGEHGAAVDDAGQPLRLLLVGAELGDGQRARHGGVQERDRRNGAPDLLEQHTRVEDPVAQTTLTLGHGHAEEVGLGQLLPGVAVEPLRIGVELLQPLHRHARLEDAAERFDERLLLLAEPEVHVE